MPPDAHDEPRLCVMLSGTGRTLENLYRRRDAGALDAGIALVIASRACPGLEIARRHGTPTLLIEGEPTADALRGAWEASGVSHVALAGYLRRLPILPGWETRIVNIHPALLPSFGGAGMYGRRVHEAVLGAGCRVSGCTVHLCNDLFDDGPILAQACCEVREDDTAESLAARVFDLECALYPDTINRLVRHGVVVEGRRARLKVQNCVG